jgi:transglutaminase-like putative cysteine protease
VTESWLLNVVHRSGFTYHVPTVSSYNEVRVTPRTEARQRVLDATVEVSPAASLFRYVDYFGSVVTAFDLHRKHSELTVTASCVVETSPPPPVEPSVPWSVLEDPGLQDELSEYLDATPRTVTDDDIARAAVAVRAEADPHAAGLAASAWVHSQLAYVSGSTGVHTSAVEALREGRGVCQDFAHLTLAVLRAAGVPSRYVSGYLHPNREAGVGVTVNGESHAWVEWWAGGWRGFDPTNGTAPGLGHVTVARGRDYTDVAPLKGIYHGGDASTSDVVVEVTRHR